MWRRLNDLVSLYVAGRNDTVGPLVRLNWWLKLLEVRRVAAGLFDAHHPHRTYRCLRQPAARWEESMFAAAKEVDRPEAFPYKTKLHAFHGGRVRTAKSFLRRLSHVLKEPGFDSHPMDGVR